MGRQLTVSSLLEFAHETDQVDDEDEREELKIAYEEYTEELEREDMKGITFSLETRSRATSL